MLALSRVSLFLQLGGRDALPATSLPRVSRKQQIVQINPPKVLTDKGIARNNAGYAKYVFLLII